METALTKQYAIRTSLIGAFVAGLCCFSPLVLFLVGLASASFAGSLADSLYFQYRWWFRLAGFLFLVIAYGLQYRKSARTCSADEKVKLRRRMLNLFLLSSAVFIAAYAVWLYVVVEYLGIKAGVWSLPSSFNWRELL